VVRLADSPHCDDAGNTKIDDRYKPERIRLLDLHRAFRGWSGVSGSQSTSAADTMKSPTMSQKL